VSDGRLLQHAVNARGVGHVGLQRERAGRRLMPSRGALRRANPATAQPSLTSNSITARPKLRAPNKTHFAA